MWSTKGGKGLHGPDKQQDALRDVRSGAYDKGGPNRAPHLSEGHRTEHQSARRGADVRQGVPDTVHRRNRTCPMAYLAGEWARWTRTPDEVTNRMKAPHLSKQAGRRPCPAGKPPFPAGFVMTDELMLFLALAGGFTV
jgi:hypothetical protein